MPAPLIFGSGAAVATGVTRRAYRRALAQELGHYRTLTVTATALTATTPDAARQVLCSSLASDGVTTGRFDGHYLYVVDGAQAGATRRVLDGGYDGPIASLMLDNPFSAPLESGTTIEVTNTLPSDYYLDIKGFNQIVNEALGRLTVWARTTITGNGTRSHNLNDYPWIASADQIDAVEDRVNASLTDPTTRSPYGFSVQTDGATRTLVPDVTYATSETFSLISIRRADTWIKSAGVWAASTIGLASDTDEAAAPLHWVRVFGAVLALRHLIEATDEDETLSEERRERRIARYRRRLDTYAGAVRNIVVNELPRPSSPPAAAFVNQSYGSYENIVGDQTWP